MKVLVVGSKSIHLSSFIKGLNTVDIFPDFLAEEPCDFEGVGKEFITSFRSMNPISVLRSNQKIKEILTESQPDLVHIHQVNRLAYFVSRACGKMGIPCVTTAWGSDVLLVPDQNRFFRFLVKQTLKRSHFITADSQQMITAMLTLEPDEEKYVWLQYGIDPVEPKEKQKIIYSNRLHKPLYRIDKIIEYFADFATKHQDWKLVIGAIGEESDRLKELTNKAGLSDRVEFVGWLEKEDNQRWYAVSSVYISIPESDGTSVSLLEAMSANCIPIVSDLEVSREWIESGKNGIIEDGTTNPLAQALMIDRAECIAINQKQVQEKAYRRSTIQTFCSLYQRLKRT